MMPHSNVPVNLKLVKIIVLIDQTKHKIKYHLVLKGTSADRGSKHFFLPCANATTLSVSSEYLLKKD